MNPKRRVGRRIDHQKFCEIEGWQQRKTATGKSGTHHVNYEFTLPDGRILITRISHPRDRTDYGVSIWAHILREQLHVDDEEFWRCVDDGVPPQRGRPPAPTETIPVAVVRTLIDQAKIPEAEVRSMTRAEALQRLNDFYSGLS
ncbi:cytotoxic translational repressor of toxin-antitoxin stability system [Tersicoccus phoenicis]|uniref:Cytotoxic translational repressor of toxin-antitoxin stability system n=1 Tax=Tersicoccus phoenicis TaxID=554083 RepID=A0A1R1LCH6_9MICC|nr:cytotoxic translational repressor of toxin-antitoxin stability system [Tersicoccus phoenicis]OMH25196.1 cytotoxic translational repressor of toxin-antitoxin stability system [Tersicoccus phoenicis]